MAACVCDDMHNLIKKLKQLLLLGGFAVFVLLAVLGVLEFLLRRYHFWGAKISWSEPDTMIAYRYTPGATYWNNGENDHPISGRINRHGWRDRDWTEAKPPNTYRIAILGDSFVEAFQVEAESTFVRLAEAELNRVSSRRVELMNFGRSGFTTTEELLVLERDVAKFSPDMVVLFFFPENDIADVDPQFDPNPMRPFFINTANGELKPDFSFAQTNNFKVRNAINGLKQHSALFSLVVERINLLQHNLAIQQQAATVSTPQPTTLAASQITGVMSLATANPDSCYTRAFALNQALLQKINERCRQMQARFLLVTINTSAYRTDRAAHWQAIDSTYNAHYFDEALAAFARQNDIGFIGLQKVFMEAYQHNGRELQWTHWNYAGHALVAKVLAQHLMQMDATKSFLGTHL